METIKVVFVTVVMSFLIFVFWRLDSSVIDSILYTTYMVIPLFLLGVMMFNYLQYSKFWLYVSRKHKDEYENMRKN